MTTIVSDLSMMIADRLEDDSGTKRRCHKIYRVKGALIGAAGSSGAGLAFVDWYKDKRKKKPELDDFEALVLTPSGLYYYDNYLVPDDVGPVHAIGTGKPFVMAALKSGSTLKESVITACDLDMYSGLFSSDDYQPQIERLIK